MLRQQARDKILGIVGWTATLGALGFVGLGLFVIATGDEPPGQVIEGLWNGNTPGFLFLLLLAIAFISLWVRTLLRGAGPKAHSPGG